MHIIAQCDFQLLSSCFLLVFPSFLIRSDGIHSNLSSEICAVAAGNEVEQGDGLEGDGGGRVGDANSFVYHN